MSDSPNPVDERNPLVPSEQRDAALDAHGYDPADYRWVPVLRKPRSDGWTPQRQVDFIAALSDMGSVAGAARDVGMSVQSCYRLRRSPGAEAFAAAWEAAIQEASRRLADIAFERAINGVEEPVLDKDGHCIYVRTRYNDRLLMFLMRAHSPERYRHAHQSVRQPFELPAPATVPVGEALRALEPVQPAEPHRLLPPEDLEVALQCADILDGKLPHWDDYRTKLDYAPVKAPLGPEFEAALARAKRVGAGLSPEPPASEAYDDGDNEEEEQGPFLA
ncbi:MAG TPA: hypothetical protein VF628_07065 [Allosphingosinicella sp.]|jgi:hypothetical protein